MPKSAASAQDPITDAPLRDPGQSLREQLLDRVVDRLVFWLVASVIALTIAALEWIRWLTGIRLMPIPFSLLALVLGAISAWRWWTIRREIEQLRLGLKGERAVGQLLQSALLPLGYFVIHDICIGDYNIDHAIIGPGGVFAVEVKTRSKPKRGGGKVTYDGTKVLVDGFAPARDPIVQARAAATSLQNILSEYTGRTTAVRSVVLFPGRWVDPPPRGAETWVLNAKHFIAYVERENAKLSTEDCRLFRNGLARYVREQVE